MPDALSIGRYLVIRTLSGWCVLAPSQESARFPFLLVDGPYPEQREAEHAARRLTLTPVTERNVQHG